VPALDRVRGIRVVAAPTALDRARWSGDPVTVLRSAPDDAFALGATAVAIDDPYAIVEDETGFVGGWFDVEAIAAHLEWLLPRDRPAFAQGSIAGVPAKVWLPDGDRVFVVVAAAYADDLIGRLR
jgi:hypothetical protein